MSESRKRLFDLLAELSEDQEIVDKNYIADAETFWKSLTKEQQMQCFYVVSRTIVDSELKEISIVIVRYYMIALSFLQKVTT